MEQMEKVLSPRLRVILDMIPQGGALADIGCDHAYLSIALAMRDPGRRIYAMDVRKGPLERAGQNIRKYGLEDRVETRLSDGFQALRPGETEAAVLAGMGGTLMEKLLRAGLLLFTSGYTLVLSPQSEPERVRRFLNEEGFIISEERIVCEEGKYYPVILAKRDGGDVISAACDGTDVLPAAHDGTDNKSAAAHDGAGNKSVAAPGFGFAASLKITDREARWAAEHFGEKLLQSPDPAVDRYLEKELAGRESILKGLEGREGEGAAARREELFQEIAVIRLFIGQRNIWEAKRGREN